MGKGGGKGGGSGSEWNVVSSRKGIVLTGTDGKDYITGNDKDNVLYGLGDTDWLLGGDGNDTLHGGPGDDSLHGGNGDDYLYGDDDNDWLQGGAGSDYMYGGTGYDIAAFTEIAPSSPGGGGLQITVTGYDDDNASDYVVFNPGTGDTDMVFNVEQIIGSNYNDLMIGDVGNDYLVGARGEDTIIGNAGNDTLYGSLDNDTIYAGSATIDLNGEVIDHAGDSGSDDTLVFLHYNTDGKSGTLDLNPLGDGRDTVFNFDLFHDKIEFFGNESVLPYLTFELINGDKDTVLTYATDSAITLKDVVITSLDDITIVDSVDVHLFG